MKKILSVTVLLLIGINIANAQSFSPDRPGIANGSFITPESMLGVEAGIQFSSSDFVNQFSLGQVLLRYGVQEKLEVRASLGSFTSATYTLLGGEQTESGFQDMTVGAKYNFVSGSGNPSISGLFNVSLPVGADAFTSDEFVPSLGVLADHSLNEMWGISSNLGYYFGVDNLEDNWLFTLTPGFSIPSNENMAGYFGYAGRYYGEGFNLHWLEAGATYLLESGAQLDVNLGFETENERLFIGAGFAKGF